MRGKGEYVEALTTFDDIIVENRRLLLTGGFVGFTVWMVISAFYYIAESGNPAMIWKYDGCWAPGDDPSAQASMPACPNRYQSIVWSSYFTLLNLFGEFPLIDNHNTWGRVIGTFTAVVAVAVVSDARGAFSSAQLFLSRGSHRCRSSPPPRSSPSPPASSATASPR